MFYSSCITLTVCFECGYPQVINARVEHIPCRTWMHAPPRLFRRGPIINRIAFSFYSGGQMTTRPELLYLPLVEIMAIRGISPRVTGISEADFFLFRFVELLSFPPEFDSVFRGQRLPRWAKMKIRVKNRRIGVREIKLVSLIDGELFVSKYRPISRECI